MPSRPSRAGTFLPIRLRKPLGVRAGETIGRTQDRESGHMSARFFHFDARILLIAVRTSPR